MVFTGHVSIGGRKITNLRYADDTTLIARSAEELQELIDSVKLCSEELGLLLNVKKTKVMICGGDVNQEVMVDGKNKVQVDSFNFLGSYISNEGGS